MMSRPDYREAERLLHHLFRPFGPQIGWLYRYAETHRILSGLAEWAGDRLDDVAIRIVERRIARGKPAPWTRYNDD